MAHLVFQTAFPGDLFLSIPLIKRIHLWDPNTKLVLACRPGLGEFFVKSHLVDEVIEIDKKSPGGRKASLKKILDQKWDTVFVPHESPRTALWMTRVKAQKKVGFAKWWNKFIFDLRVTKPMQFPDALRQMSLLAPLDPRLAELYAEEHFAELQSPMERGAVLDFRKPVIPEWASMKVKSHKATQKKIFLAPGSVWATKRWTATGYQDLARLLLKRGYAVELVGSKDERPLCDTIAAAVPGVTNIAGQTSLAQLVDLFTTGSALVCNDSGAMHAAAAADLPLVAVFGPTTLELGFRPWSDRALVVQKDLKCRPCGKHGSEKCPIGTHECMESIPAGVVLNALESLLNKDAKLSLSQ